MEPEAVKTIKVKYQSLAPYLNENTKRVWAAIEALSLGRGGISTVAQATSLSRTTIYVGMRALRQPPEERADQSERLEIRRPGAGRKRIEAIDKTLLEDLEALVGSMTRGDPESPLRWTCKSTTKLAKELQHMGHQVSPRTVYTLLQGQGYSLQSNRKEGSKHPDRDAQFLYISNMVKKFHRLHRPVISVDAKKKELIGEFHTPGQEWHKKGHPIAVQMHDVADPTLGKVVPYGIYDLYLNPGWVSVGIDHDTAEFAVESIRRWWDEMGQPLYPRVKHLLITADCGGSNGHRIRLWKLKLQELADETHLTMYVCHFPPGTSKWNRIEHRMFCHLSQNWRGRPLTSRQVVVNLISHTTTNTGLKIRARLDENPYPTGIKVADQEFNSIALIRDKFHGEWNYQIKPRAIS